MRTAQTQFLTKKSTFLKAILLNLGAMPMLLSVILNLLVVGAVQTKAVAQEKLSDGKNRDLVAQKPKQIAQKQSLVESIKPAVVRIVNGCVGKAYWSKNGKTYNLAAGSFGSGYFVSSGGAVVNDQGKVVGMVTFGGNPVNGQLVSGFSKACAK